jgi:hypothetical protein
MFWIHLIGTLEVHKAMRMQTSENFISEGCTRQSLFKWLHIVDVVVLGFKSINSSALETFTKVLHDRSIKLRYRENLVTKRSTFSYLSCDYIMHTPCN